MCVIQSDSGTSSISTQQQQYVLTRAGTHVVSRLYRVSPREAEMVYIRTVLLHFKGAPAFAELRRVNDVRCRISVMPVKRKAFERLSDDAEQR